LTRRGADTGKRFETGKDLISVKQTVNRQGLFTALYGRGKGVEIPGDDPNNVAYGRRLTFANEIWAIADGDSADKPSLQEWVGDTVALAAYGAVGGTRHIYGYVNFDDEIDAANLLQRTWDYLQTVNAPKVTYELTAVTLEGLTGREHEAVRLGDTNVVINKAYNPWITASVRVVGIDRNLLDDTDAQLTLGNYIPVITDSMIAVQLQQAAMQDRQAVWDNANAITTTPTGGGDLAYALDLLKTQLFSTISHFYTDVNGNSIWESADGTKALKIGAGILALANTKTAGEFDWTTYATGDGVTANAVLAATGTFLLLTAGVTGSHRMETGIGEGNEPYIKFYNTDNVLIMTLNKSGLKFGNSIISTYTTVGGRVGPGIFAA
jgi:hypothetical protein